MDRLEETERTVARWHEVVNTADLTAARTLVTDPLVVNGPKGAGPIGADEFTAWIVRSGVRLMPCSYHPIAPSLLVVEQDARWPADAVSTRVATLFRARAGRVSAALRFPTLREALSFASLCRELAATEPPADPAARPADPADPADPAARPADPADGPGQTLFRFIRYWSRRALVGQARAGERGRDVWVTETVDTLASGNREVTVNDVADELGIDQSGASRMLAAATEGGYLEMLPSGADARRRVASLTSAGRKLLAGAHAWQEQVFAELSTGWTADERETFHRGLLRLLATSADATPPAVASLEP